MTCRQLLTVAVCVVLDGRLQSPPGYHIGVASAVHDAVTEVLAGGRFRVTVNRVSHSSRERQLIATAERLYPSTHVLLAATRDTAEHNRLRLMGSGVVSDGRRKPSPRPAGHPADRWWFDSFDDTWTPFAVTGAAVDYHLGRIRDIAAGRGKFTSRAGHVADRGTFDYTATVRREARADGACVVDLRLSWSYSCGMMCGISFTHTRTVSFDGKGAVVDIKGDERPSVTVS